jgi:hypothetical protein
VGGKEMTEQSRIVPSLNRDLVREIQNDILDSSIALTSILRKAKVLAYQLDNDEFKQWVSQELDGYTGDSDTVPDYRRGSTHSLGHFVGLFGSTMRNTPIPTLGLPEESSEYAESLLLIGKLQDGLAP